MKLTRHTDLALRVLLHLGVNPGRAVPISEVARVQQVSHNHLMKVVHNLVRADFLTSTRGRAGGVQLARAAAAIRIGDVVRACEPESPLVDCAECRIAGSCALPAPLAEALRAFMAVLDGYSLADIITSSRGLELVLGRAA